MRTFGGMSERFGKARQLKAGLAGVNSLLMMTIADFSRSLQSSEQHPARRLPAPDRNVAEGPREPGPDRSLAAAAGASGAGSDGHPFYHYLGH